MSEDVEARPTAASASTASASTAAASVRADRATSGEPAAAGEAAVSVHTGHGHGPHDMRYHHGTSPAAWAGAIPALVGVFVAAIGGTIPHFHPIIFAIGAALFVLGGITAVVMRALGLGND